MNEEKPTQKTDETRGTNKEFQDAVGALRDHIWYRFNIRGAVHEEESSRDSHRQMADQLAAKNNLSVVWGENESATKIMKGEQEVTDRGTEYMRFGNKGTVPSQW